MSNLTAKQIYEMIDYLQNVYWQAIDSSNPLYMQAYDKLQNLCNLYTIPFDSNSDSIYSQLLERINNQDSDSRKNIPYQHPADIIQAMKDDLQDCKDLSTLMEIIQKYKQISETFRNLIFSYVRDYGELQLLLEDEIDRNIEQINNQQSIEEMSKPLKVGLVDQDGWPLTDENDEELFRLETEEEVNGRIKQELNNREKAIDKVNSLKASLNRWVEYLVVLPRLSAMYRAINVSIQQALDFENELILSSFKSNEEFMKELNDFMTHDSDKFEYLYHGTTCVEDAERIITEGLYMDRKDLDSTTYSEFSPEQLLLYRRGFDKQIGAHAIVVIKKPINEDIVRELTESEQKRAHVAQSGLGGFNGMHYIIPSEYILGYVNKREQKVVHNHSLDLQPKTTKF